MLRRLGCTPAEAVALAILAVAAVAAVGLLWLQANPSLIGPPVSGAAVEASEVASESGPLVVSDADVIVHVAGAVARPGVYTLPGGSRVGDALTAAGGAGRRAVLDTLNLARPLTDGEQILVPDERALKAATSGTPASPGAAPPSTGAPAAGSTPASVSLNQATVADLETLPGIGPVLAQRIIDHRDSIGGFTEVGQLREVSGIGEKTFQSLAPLVSL